MIPTVISYDIQDDPLGPSGYARTKTIIIKHGKIATVDRPQRLGVTIKGIQSVKGDFYNHVDEESFRQLQKVKEATKIGDKIRLYTGSPEDLVCIKS